ncbi:hypothetical protein GCM10009827_032080 [Dactylosporangium maewongense]|uniref:Uncharacterized protein n=1 Tax=Dactylosporangium maewongense TaxID=634393 RepID=A0ABN2AAA5_9ACTN
MLDLTRELIRRHERGAAGRHDVWVRAAARAIRRAGDAHDAAALLPCFLDDPEARGALLPVLACHGDRSTAAALLAVHDRNPEVLHVVGWFGHEPATLILWDHALHGDWDEQCSAVLGLLHLRCDGIDVAAELRRHEGRGLFPELLPALAVKTGDPSWARRLLDWGTTGASTDCNGGLLLGLALLGAAGRDAFDLALWSPAWETWSGSTGTVRWAARGVLATGWGVAGLRSRFDAHVSAATDPADRTNAVLVLTGVVDRWLDDEWTGLRAAVAPPETREQAFRLLFEGERALDRLAERLVDEAGDGGRTEIEPGLPLRFVLRQVYDLRRRLEDAVHHEADLDARTRTP